MINNRGRFEQWLPAAFDGEFDWDFLKLAFRGTKIMPMDFDAVVERNSHYLVFETKSKGKQIDTGQKITLTNAWKSKGFTVIHVEGKTAPEITGFAIYWEWDNPKEKNVGDHQILTRNATDLLYVVRCWFCKADNKVRPTRAEWDKEIWVNDYDGDPIEPSLASIRELETV